MADLNHLWLMAQQQSFPKSSLYVVATPIGNLADITVRALAVLSHVDAIACEDTRNTAQMLGQFGISKPLIASHQHNENEAAQKIIERLLRGESIALVSDAGTPGVSDPGARVVSAVQDAGLRVTPIPGCSAAITALSGSGLLQDQFLFVGFLPSKKGQRDAILSDLRHQSATLIFYEAPHRIKDTMQALGELFPPDRKIVLARELTKLFEQVHRCNLDQALAWVESDVHREKGEYVILLDGESVDMQSDLEESKRILSILLSSVSVSQAAQLASQITGQKKNALYQLALQLNQDQTS